MRRRRGGQITTAYVGRTWGSARDCWDMTCFGNCHRVSRRNVNDIITRGVPMRPSIYMLHHLFTVNVHRIHCRWINIDTIDICKKIMRTHTYIHPHTNCTRTIIRTYTHIPMHIPTDTSHTHKLSTHTHKLTTHTHPQPYSHSHTHTLFSFVFIAFLFYFVEF